GTLPHLRDHHVGDVLGRADGMRAYAIRHLARHLTHQSVDGSQMDGDVGVLDRAGVEERRHEVDGVVWTPEVESPIVLPAVPGLPDSVNVLCHPRAGGGPRHAVSALKMGTDLRA